MKLARGFRASQYFETNANSVFQLTQIPVLAPHPQKAPVSPPPQIYSYDIRHPTTMGDTQSSLAHTNRRPRGATVQKRSGEHRA